MNKSPASALNLLPHGNEFRFITRLVALNPGVDGAAEYVPDGSEPWFKGHFPGNPLVPGVILIEAAAQLAGIVAQSDPAIPPLEGLKLTAVRNAKILGTSGPGEIIVIRAQVTGRMGHLVQAHATAEVAGKTILETSVTLSGAKANEP